MHKYGREFSLRVMENQGGCVSERVSRTCLRVKHALLERRMERLLAEREVHLLTTLADTRSLGNSQSRLHQTSSWTHTWQRSLADTKLIGALVSLADLKTVEKEVPRCVAPIQASAQRSEGSEIGDGSGSCRIGRRVGWRPRAGGGGGGDGGKGWKWGRGRGGCIHGFKQEIRGVEKQKVKEERGWEEGRGRDLDRWRSSWGDVAADDL